MDLKWTVYYHLLISVNFVLISTEEELSTNTNSSLDFKKQNLYEAMYGSLNTVLGGDHPTGRYAWKEHSRVHFTCPQGSFISNIGYSYDLGKDERTNQFKRWYLHDTLNGRFRQNGTIKFVRGQGTKSNSSKSTSAAARSIFQKLINDRKESSNSRTGCDAVLFCLGYQACLFQLSMELCADDPESLDVKYLKLELSCVPDDGFYDAIQTLSPNQQNALDGSKDHLMYISFDHEKTDDKFTVIKTFVLPEKDAFWVSCPPPSEAHAEGYGGWCKGPAPTHTEISTELWHTLGRSVEESCRDELLQVYCAYHFNKTGGCVPPMYVEKPKRGTVLHPGKMRFNFNALPTNGHRPDLNSIVEARRSLNTVLIPVKFAFLIIAHTCEDCVMQLIDVIYRPYFFYVIHVDFRQDNVRDELVKRINVLPHYANVRVLPKERSFTASWGSFYILRAELEGIEELARMGAWDFVINLSGADLPFTDVDDMAATYAAYRTRNFVGVRETWKDRRSSAKDVSVWHACGNHVYNVTSRGPPPPWSTQLSASQWFILHRGFATTIINQDFRSRRLNQIQFFQQTCIVPDESYIQSMLFNSDFKYTYIYDHSRLYHFPSSRYDIRGLCKHSFDIDYCGQSPNYFEEHDIKTFKGSTQKYNFGRKHPYDAKHPTRQAAIKIITNSDMYHFIEGRGTVDQVFIRQLVEEALYQKFGKSWRDRYDVKDIVKVRILRTLTADNPCCKPIYLTRNTLQFRYKYWIDFSVVDLITHRKLFMRTSMKPIDNFNCFVHGHIKALSVSFMKDNFVPHEPDSDRPIAYTIYFSRGDNRNIDGKKHKCKDLPDPTSPIYDFIQAKNSSRYNYAKFTKDELKFKAMLISPGGTESCEWHSQITLSTYDKLFKKNTRSKLKMKMACSPINTPGWWRLVLQQTGVKNPFPYTSSMFVGHTGRSKQNISENIKGLWNLEGLMELNIEDIEFQAKWSHPNVFDTPRLGATVKHENTSVMKPPIITKHISNSSHSTSDLVYAKQVGSDENKAMDAEDGQVFRKLRNERMSEIKNNINNIPVYDKNNKEWFMNELDMWRHRRGQKLFAAGSIIKCVFLFVALYLLAHLYNFYLDRYTVIHFT
ncbi:uncharacterized protein [Antedon mediterranea]|uniref:uncharacterized protein isoform X2 n=1 Tax=Antedon mediterranea TaxID=105859 RepID=UPI003AF9FC39